MLRAFRYFCGRKVGQPIVPSVEAGVAARDRIVLVSPVVVIVRQFVERGRAHDVVLVRTGDQCLVDAARPPRRLRLHCDGGGNRNCAEQKYFRFHDVDLSGSELRRKPKTTPCRERKVGLSAFQAMEFAFSRARGENRTDRFQS